MSRKNNVNSEVIQKMSESDVYQWQVAEAIGISEGALCRWMRKKLPPEQEKQVFEAIDAIAKERNNHE